MSDNYTLEGEKFMMGNFKRIGRSRVYMILMMVVYMSMLLLPVASLVVTPAGAADLQKPSATRGWAKFPTDVQDWVQTIMDWGMTVAVILAVTIILLYFIIGKGADHSGGVQQKNISTQKIIFTFLELILLGVVISLIWAYFWTKPAV